MGGTKRRDRDPPNHTDKAVRKVLKGALAAGWAAEHPGSHAWGWLCCSGVEKQVPECRIVVFSTPKGDNQAKVLARALAKCPHGHAIPLKK